MSLFELTFTLTSVILGLALTQIAASIHKLAYAGRRVRWAPEPLLLTGIVFTVIVSVWLNQWYERDVTSVTTGRMLLQVLKMMCIYIAAASVLPEPREGEDTDLYAYYDATRSLTYGALISGLVMFTLYNLTSGAPIRVNAGLLMDILLFPAIFLSLILIRWRPFNIGLLTLALGFWLWLIAGARITTG
jgi:hypothetical protein